MATEMEIAADVRQAITDQAGYTHAEITDEKDLELDIGLDALGKLEIVMDIEEQFGIFISDDEVREIGTVGELIKAVTRKLQEKGQVRG